jgi:hypothetical protein
LLTNRLLEIFNGVKPVNHDEPYLGLGDIVKAIKLPVPHLDQQPIFWNLNITGADTFCRNPNHSPSSIAQTPFGMLRYRVRQNPVSPPLAHGLWKFYLDLPTNVSPRYSAGSVASRRGMSPQVPESLRRVTRTLLDQYRNSIAAVTDGQAPAFLLFLSQCKIHGWIPEAEEVIGGLYLDFNEHYGRLLGDDPSPGDVVDYLILRQSNSPTADVEFLQNPTELLSVILVSAAPCLISTMRSTLH